MAGLRKLCLLGLGALIQPDWVGAQALRGTNISPDVYQWTVLWNYSPTPQHSWVRLYPVQDAEHVAEVEFYNIPVHNLDTEIFSLEIDGMLVEVTVEVGLYADDFISVEPPEDYIAVPSATYAPEHQNTKILIFPRKNVPVM